LTRISVGGNNVWGVNANQQVWRFNGSSWDQMPGSANHISAASDGSVWCINASQQMWSWNGAGWQQMPGAAIGVSTGGRQNTWCTNPAGIIHWWNPQINNWQATDGNATQISAGEDGTVCCVNASQQIWIRRGGISGQWQQLPGAAVCVSCHDANTIAVVNAGGQIFSWNPAINNWQPQSGEGKWISVGGSGYSHVWVVNPAGMPHRHMGAAPMAAPSMGVQVQVHVPVPGMGMSMGGHHNKKSKSSSSSSS